MNQSFASMRMRCGLGGALNKACIQVPSKSRSPYNSYLGNMALMTMLFHAGYLIRQLSI
jgi:hypothetical protein